MIFQKKIKKNNNTGKNFTPARTEADVEYENYWDLEKGIFKIGDFVMQYKPRTKQQGVKR